MVCPPGPPRGPGREWHEFIVAKLTPALEVCLSLKIEPVTPLSSAASASEVPPSGLHGNRFQRGVRILPWSISPLPPVQRFRFSDISINLDI